MQIRTATLAALLCFVPIGCDMQRGNHAVTSTSTVAVLNCDGYLTVFAGHNIDEHRGTDDPLLYFLEIIDGYDTDGASTSSAHETYTSSVTDTWSATDGETIFSLTWNRSDDSVVVGDDRYRRSDGIVFVSIASSPSIIETHQIKPDVPNPTRDDVLTAIRNRFSANLLLSNLSVYKNKADGE